MLTTPLFYASGEPHIGHAYTLILASLVKNYNQLIGRKVYLLTGVDEHGEKILLKTKESGLDTQIFVDQISRRFQELGKTLEISTDYFIRTSSEEHKSFVKNFFYDLVDKDSIYLSQWSGYKCISCETNYSNKHYEKNNVCEMGHPLIVREEESYFLRVKEFKEWLLSHYQKDEIIFPKHYENNLTAGIINELEDLSVTRKNLSWGVQLKDKPFCIYVWFDALLGYISNKEVFTKWSEGSEVVQIIGKEIFKFHSIYFPILLNSQNLPLPSRLVVHGWLTNQKNRKISKSESNLIEKPLPQLLEEFSLETIRWYCAFLNWGQDHLFSEEILKEYHNKYLLNLYGNLINRLKGILSKHNLTTSKLDNSEFFQNSELQTEFLAGSQLLMEITSRIQSLEFYWIIHQVVELLEKANKLLEKFEPWKLDSSSTEFRELNVLLYRQLILSSYLLFPIFSKEKWTEIQKSLSFFSEDAKIDIEFFNSLANFENIILPKAHNLFTKYE